MSRLPAANPVHACLAEAIDETVKLFHRLKVAASEIHGGGELAAAKRGVLKSLQAEQPQTVPQLARARPVSRQHIQTLVDALAALGYLAFADNPHHRRSRWVRLSPQGEKLIAAIDAREQAIFARLQAKLDAGKVRAAAKTLRELRHLLEGDAWQDLIEGRRTKRAST